MKIAIGQIQVIAANCKANFQSMHKFILQAIENNAELIIFPEMAVPGYFNGDTWEQKGFLKDCEYYHKELLKLSKKIDIIFGSVGIDWKKKNEDGRVRKYNSVYCASKGKFVVNAKTKYNFWIKTLMPNYREFDDSRHFYDLRKLAAEKNVKIQDLYQPVKIKYRNKQINIGISICEDAWSQDYSVNPIESFSKKFKHHFFVNLSASPFTLEKTQKRNKLFSTVTKGLNLPLIYINCTGVQNIGKTIYGFDGSSAFYTKKGEFYPAGDFFAESLQFINLNTENGKWDIQQEDKESNKSLDRINQLQISLEYITKKCLAEWGIKKVVIGASGGIDSALSAVLFSRVLGSQNVYLINMPSRFNSELTKNAAKALAEQLKCPFAVIPISDSIEFTKKQLQEIQFTQSAEKLTFPALVYENIQARDRGGRILAAVAAAVGGVFTCNANKAEMTIGYSTLYGDLSGFMAPLADLWKQDIYALARHYNLQVYQTAVIPQETLAVVPSAELSDTQNVLKNQGDPLCYPYHDSLFAAWIEHWERKTPEDCLMAYLNKSLGKMLGCDQELVEKLFPSVQVFISDLERWWKLYRGMGAFKRVQAPPVIAVTRRAFGFDHREQIGSVTFSSEYESLKSKIMKL